MQENLAPSKAVQIFIFQVSKINRKNEKRLTNRKVITMYKTSCNLNFPKK